MAGITLSVSFDAEAFESLSSEPSIRLDQPMRIFRMESLFHLGHWPRDGDLVADLGFLNRQWRVVQRTIVVDESGDAKISLLVGNTTDLDFDCDPAADRVQFTDTAMAAITAEYAGRTSLNESFGMQLMLGALKACPVLQAGDVVQDARLSRHKFLVKQRLFLWTAGDETRTEIRYLLDAGMRAGEWAELED